MSETLLFGHHNASYRGLVAHKQSTSALHGLLDLNMHFKDKSEYGLACEADFNTKTCGQRMTVSLSQGWIVLRTFESTKVGKIRVVGHPLGM